MRVVLNLALCSLLAAGAALAQRGGMGGGGGMRGGGGGGFRGGTSMGGGGFRGGTGGYGGFHGGTGYRGGVGYGGFHGGYYGGHGGYYGGYYGNSFRYGYGFRGGYYGGLGYGWGWPGWGFGWAGYWPGYYGYGLGYYDGWSDPYYYYSSYPAYGYGTAAYAASPAVTVVYPQQAQQPSNTVVIERATPVTHEYDQYGQEIHSSGGTSTGGGPTGNASPVYLIAFKDHVIRAASSYWIDGRTLHYVTLQHEERQASLDTVDRDMTLQLNRERRISMQLPQ
jgi:hypothetical protein